MDDRFRDLQIRRDLSVPDEHDCSVDGHRFVFVGRAEDGTVFVRCRKCGREEEQ
jgi:hypothetical protein